MCTYSTFLVKKLTKYLKRENKHTEKSNPSNSSSAFAWYNSQTRWGGDGGETVGRTECAAPLKSVETSSPATVNTTFPFFGIMTHIRPGAVKVTFKRLKEPARSQGRMASSKARPGSKKLWKESDDGVFQDRARIWIRVTAPEALYVTTFHVVIFSSWFGGTNRRKK